MLKALKIVFKNPVNIAVVFAVALFLFLFVIWFPNISLMKSMLGSDNFSFAGKIGFLWSSLGYFESNFTLYSRFIVVVVASLSGINIAMLVFYLRKRRKLDKAAGVGLLGTIVGVIGFGCVACNSVILSSIIGISATAGFVGILPFGGTEIGLIGILLLIVSIVLVAKKISNPAICKINN
jgi:hypothetical protein